MKKRLPGLAVSLSVAFCCACVCSNRPAKAADALPDLGRYYVVEGRFGTALDAAYSDAESARGVAGVQGISVDGGIMVKAEQPGRIQHSRGQ